LLRAGSVTEKTFNLIGLVARFLTFPQFGWIKSQAVDFGAEYFSAMLLGSTFLDHVGWVRLEKNGVSPSPLVYWNHRFKQEIPRKIRMTKNLDTKIRETKGLARDDLL